MQQIPMDNNPHVCWNRVHLSWWFCKQQVSPYVSLVSVRWQNLNEILLSQIASLERAQNKFFLVLVLILFFYIEVVWATSGGAYACKNRYLGFPQGDFSWRTAQFSVWRWVPEWVQFLACFLTLALFPPPPPKPGGTDCQLQLQSGIFFVIVIQWQPQVLFHKSGGILFRILTNSDFLRAFSPHLCNMIVSWVAWMRYVCFYLVTKQSVQSATLIHSHFYFTYQARSRFCFLCFLLLGWRAQGSSP